MRSKDKTEKEIKAQAELLLGSTLDSAEFDHRRLRQVAGVFQCARCLMWRDVDDESKEIDNTCQTCARPLLGDDDG